MPISAEEIVSLHAHRIGTRGDYLSRMKQVSLHYNNEVLVPLPELDSNEKAAVANLLAQGVDQRSMRVASVMPNLEFPSIRDGFKGADDRADKRRMAGLGWWEMNNYNMKMRRRARYESAYACAPVSLSPVSLNPNDKRQIPFWRVRNPLSTFPADVADPDNMEPDDCIFEDYRTLKWLTDNFPAQANSLFTGKATPGSLFCVLEYVDAYETVLVAVGAKKESKGFMSGTIESGASSIVLSRVPNRAGICPVVVPQRIALDKVMSRFEGMLGMFHRQAKLDALLTIAVQRSVFPDEWVVAQPNSNGMAPKIVQNADGKMGVRGVIQNGTIQALNPAPGQQSVDALDRLERSARLSAGIPAEWGGESGSNIRTARRGESVMSSAVDPDIQEAQEIFAASMEAEMRRAVAIQKAYFGKKPTLFLLGMDGKVGSITDYTPDEIFETDLCRVTYPLPGSDANQMAVMIGQKVGIGELSIQSAMEMDPLIKNVKEETSRIHIEGIRKALLTGLEQQAQQGQLDPATIAKIATKMADGKTLLEDAVAQVHDEIQKEQAASKDQSAAGGADVEGVSGQPSDGASGASPEQQPGLAAPLAHLPDMGDQGATVGAPPAGLDNLKSLLGALHTTSQVPSVSNA